MQKDNINLISMFGPMVDNHTRVRSPLVTRHPADIRDSGAAVVRPLPLMLSATRDEGLAAAARLYLKNQGAFASPDLFRWDWCGWWWEEYDGHWRKQVLLPVMKSLFGYWKGSQKDLLEAIYRLVLFELKVWYTFFLYIFISTGNISRKLLQVMVWPFWKTLVRNITSSRDTL